MVRQREPFIVTRAARVVLGATIAVGLGAAVAASPVHIAPVAIAKAPPAIPATPVDFKPLGNGPAVFVQKSFGQHDEDCVTVTQVKGADGRTYATRGMICSE